MSKILKRLHLLATFMNNVTLHKEYLTISVDQRIFSKENIISASFIFLEEAYIIIDKKDEYVLINIYPKTYQKKENNSLNSNIKLLGYRFNEELINYKTYEIQSKRNENIRHTFIKRTLITNGFFEKN